MEWSKSLPDEVLWPHNTLDATATEDKPLKTELGSISFEELYNRTRRYAAYVFIYTYHLHPETVDEALQAGYMMYPINQTVK